MYRSSFVSSPLCLPKPSHLVIIHPRYLQSGNINDHLFFPRKKNLTHYEVLGIKPTATPKEIRAAYIKLCKELHPDTSSPLLGKHDRFVAINEAHFVLGRDDTRKQYDVSLGVRHHRYQPAGADYRYNYYNGANSGAGPYRHTAAGGYYRYEGNYSNGYSSSQKDNTFFIAPLFCIVLIGMGITIKEAGYKHRRHIVDTNEQFVKKREQDLYKKQKHLHIKKSNCDTTNSTDFCGKNPFEKAPLKKPEKSKSPFYHGNPSVPRLVLPPDLTKRPPNLPPQKYHLSQTEMLMLKYLHKRKAKSAEK